MKGEAFPASETMHYEACSFISDSSIVSQMIVVCVAFALLGWGMGFLLEWWLVG
jgi:hypothetical protein